MSEDVSNRGTSPVGLAHILYRPTATEIDVGVTYNDLVGLPSGSEWLITAFMNTSSVDKMVMVVPHVDPTREDEILVPPRIWIPLMADSIAIEGETAQVLLVAFGENR